MTDAFVQCVADETEIAQNPEDISFFDSDASCVKNRSDFLADAHPESFVNSDFSLNQGGSDDGFDTEESNKPDHLEPSEKETSHVAEPSPYASVHLKQDIKPIILEKEMKSSYLDYAMSVIISRALPDVRDGLKPVHRRILYAMMEERCDYNKPYRKSARVVGEVLGKYHPHGADPIYEAMVRMAQDFSMSLTLIDGQGNFGSMDGDKAAASRYTEVRLTRAAHALLQDYDKNVVDFQPNYDNTLEIPTVLPAKFPNLLVNGASGIAVGMATNIPPHNLGEVIDACCAWIDDPHLTDADLAEIVLGPDFPTGGLLLQASDFKTHYSTGSGSFMIRAKHTLESFKKERTAIVFTEIPYQVNKAHLIEKIAHLVDNKEIEGIQEIRDESDYKGIRLVIELKKDIQPDVILNHLFSATALQTSFSMNLLAIHEGRPLRMTLRQVIEAFVHFREDIVRRRTHFLLQKAREKYHTTLGLLTAVMHIDEMVRRIRASHTFEEAKQALLEPFWNLAPLLHDLQTSNPHSLLHQQLSVIDKGQYRLTEIQVKAILELRLHRLTGLEKEKVIADLEELAHSMEQAIALLEDRQKRMAIVREELLETKALFAVPRRTQIVPWQGACSVADLIQREEMVVTVTARGYIKRVPLSAYRSQQRGGKGKTGMETRDEDVVSHVFSASTHTPLLFFSSKGMAFRLMVYELPLASLQSKGKPLVGLLAFEKDETLATLLPLPEDRSLWEHYHIVFTTSLGHVRRNALSDFASIRANGKIAMKLEEEGEKLVNASLCTLDQDILLTTQNGRSIRFPVDDVRQFAGRTSTGVRGIRLLSGDCVVSMTLLQTADFTAQEREVYLKQIRKIQGEAEEEQDALSQGAVQTTEGHLEKEERLPESTFEAMKAREQWLLTISSGGFGKRTSAYAYRQAGRGGQGVVSMDLDRRTGLDLVGALLVSESDHILLLTSEGRVIRLAVGDIRLTSRKAKGVILCRLNAKEKVVSAVALPQNKEVDLVLEETEVSLPEKI